MYLICAQLRHLKLNKAHIRLLNFKTIQNVDAEQLNLVKNLFVDYKYKCKSLALPLCLL